MRGIGPGLAGQLQAADRGQGRGLRQVGQNQRHGTRAQRLFHRPQNILGAEGAGKDDAARIGVIAQAGRKDLFGQPAGGDPQHRTLA